MKKDTTIIVLITSLLLAPFALQSAQAQEDQGATGTVTIAATCGLTIDSGDPIAFGSQPRDAIPTEQTLVLSNPGSVTTTVTVSAKDWKSTTSGTVHIEGEKTRFATTDQLAGTEYLDKTPLNSTDGFITFGTIRPSPVTNATYWQLQVTLVNLPFTGTLEQQITLSGTC